MLMEKIVHSIASLLLFVLFPLTFIFQHKTIQSQELFVFISQLFIQININRCARRYINFPNFLKFQLNYPYVLWNRAAIMANLLVCSSLAFSSITVTTSLSFCLKKTLNLSSSLEAVAISGFSFE